ncbi:C2H2 zinc finger domain-containing protein [Scheffersomyces xylosifermentans]|uniref:C2H2 zinc finger domain-containing protein n=1 Tax=Scheffersomyces xylosifermentans TaxID=1304137 RepID=UPI00315C8F57
MTSSTSYNYNRRNSSATPYTIPAKHQQQINQGNHSMYQQHHHQHTNGHQQHHQSHHSMSPGSSDIHAPLSTSVPLFSREFVVRRISEGETGRLKEELRCEACGKGYKHISSLAKHLWEHTPEWNVTKKLLISKHQQVQLLEAASILVGMNETTGSRRNSTTQPDQHIQPQHSDDPRYNSPFSPSNTAETNASSHTPTPPMAEDKQPKFKNAFDPTSAASTQAFNTRENVKINYNRTNSISQYPPSEKSHIGMSSSPAIGGYLDNPKTVGDLSKRRSSSMSVPNGQVNETELKSPSPSYKAAPSIPPTATAFVPSTFDASPRIQGIIDEVDEPKQEEASTSFDEGVLGKMED